MRIEYKASVQKDLRKVPPKIAVRILRKIEQKLTAEGHRGTALTGGFAGMYRLRVGYYRVIYVRTGDGYLVLRIGHRRDVYSKGRLETF